MIWICVVMFGCTGRTAVSERRRDRWRYSFFSLKQNNSTTLCLLLCWQHSLAVSFRLWQVPARSSRSSNPQQRYCQRLATLGIRAAATGAIHPATGSITRSTLFSLSDKHEYVDNNDVLLSLYILHHLRCSQEATECRQEVQQQQWTHSVAWHTKLFLNQYLLHTVINKLSCLVSLTKICVYIYDMCLQCFWSKLKTWYRTSCVFCITYLIILFYFSICFKHREPIYCR